MAKNDLWTIDTIKGAISETESDLASWREKADLWQDMWEGDFWDEKAKDAAVADKRELITTEQPRNIVQLGIRLLGNDIKVFCPNYEGNAPGRQSADAREQFLRLLIERQGKMQKMSFMHAMKWNALTRGKMACQISWVEHLIPASQRPFALPIIYRWLDPLNVGIRTGPLGTEFAYHRYEEKVTSAIRRYPGLLKTEKFKEYKPTNQNMSDTVTMTDFWYISQENGEIYNALVMDDDMFVPVQRTRNGRKSTKAEPVAPGHPRIPILVRNNDPAPVSDEGHAANSILAPMEKSWSAMNTVASMIVTGLGRYFWPAIYLKSREDEELETGEGAVNVLADPDAEFVSPPNNNPNFPMAQSVMDMFTDSAEQGAFPAALYGDSGSQRSGYGFSLMVAAGAGRLSETVDQLKILIEEANELALCYVQKFGGGREDGVGIFGYDEQSGGAYGAFLKSQDVGERYDNTVRFNTDLDPDRIQLLQAALMMFDRNIITAGTVREDYSPKPVRRDEEQRTLIEQLMEDPDLRRARLQNAHMQWFGVPLPPGEPDFQATPAAAPAAAPAPGFQTQQGQLPLQGTTLPPEAIGQQTGQTVLGDFGQGADINQLIATGQIPSPETYLQQLQGTFSR